jgi:hypothetical protein
MRVSKRLPTGIHEVLTKLEAKGLDVHLKHDRKKRTTTLSIGNEAGVNAVGQSRCSTRDNFDKAKGTQIAFDRAMHDLSTWVGRDQIKKILK